MGAHAQASRSAAAACTDARREAGYIIRCVCGAPMRARYRLRCLCGAGAGEAERYRALFANLRSLDLRCKFLMVDPELLADIQAAQAASGGPAAGGAIGVTGPTAPMLMQAHL